MANQGQLSMLKRGAEKWNQWRKNSLRPGNNPDLARADLRGVDLRKANLYRANLRGADLSRADLREADLGEADLSDASLRGADLRETILCAAFCFQTDFSEANLVGADLRNIFSARANFSGAELPAGLQARVQSSPDSGIRPGTKTPDRATISAFHTQMGNTLEPGLPKISEDEATRRSLQSVPSASLEVPAVAESGQNHNATEHSPTSEIDEVSDQQVRRRQKSVAVLPKLGREYIEGEKRERLSQHYERDSRLRLAAIALHGVKCMVCGFDFEMVYGSHGAGYIEVHHLRPVSSLQTRTRVNPQTDMVVLCANCHRMIHRSRDGMLSPDELRNLMRQQVEAKEDQGEGWGESSTTGTSGQ